MLLTERQNGILNSIVEEYINSAEPISSKLLEKKYDFEICPATIRIEMQKLTDEGLISQPHTSAGRVPTDKGYRYFVDELLEKDIIENKTDIETENLFRKEGEIEGTIKLLQSLTKNLADISSNLALGYLMGEKILWKEGWEDILQEPEFQEKGIIHNFTEVIKNFEVTMQNLELNSPMSPAKRDGIKKRTQFSSPMSPAKRDGIKKRTQFSSPISVFIGRENPFPKAKEFTTIITKCRFQSKNIRSSPPFAAARVNEEVILAILGPKRMSYGKNINSLNALVKILEEL
ncbi:MAG: hypothetical protein Q7S82_03540 [bacterium]|nr:hypothetical protein [bacterium]